jgi:hypothetical protein
VAARLPRGSTGDLSNTAAVLPRRVWCKPHTEPACRISLSLRMTAARCVSTVLMLMFKVALMPLLLQPSATSLTIVFSRGESNWFVPRFPASIPASSLENAPL